MGQNNHKIKENEHENQTDNYTFSNIMHNRYLDAPVEGKRSDVRTRERHKSDMEYQLKSWYGCMCHLVKSIMTNKILTL